MNAPAAKPVEAASPHVMNTYGRVPIALSHGQGCRVWDINGKPYLDGLAGIAVNTLGHNHPRLVPALQDQLSKIIHSCNYYHVPGQEQLAQKLVELSGMSNVFFCSTGLEANEAVLKLARKFGHDKGIENPQIVVYERAFHGRSIATLSATGNEKIQKSFGPLVPGFIRVPLNDIEALKKATEGNPNVVAVFFETIQGEGGINAMRAGIETLRIMEEDRLLQHAEAMGNYLMGRLRAELGSHPGVKEVRGQGLMIGVELTKPCGVLINRAAEAGLLISVTADNVIRLLPPLIITQAEIDELLGLLLPLVKSFLAEA